ncbi:MAG: S-layer homology domain-containing protein [Clostridiaceae bacterium]|nr:S-layer homology domain-containing protein [Clostridiaceae bacterium]
MRKKILALFISAILLMAVLPCNAEESRFEDLPSSHWAYAAVMDLVEKGIITGKSETHFDPNSSLKREEFAKIAVLAIDEELVDKSGSFTDVEVRSWYEPYVETALMTGLLKGISDTEFGVGGTLTKQDAVVVMNRIIENREIKTEPDKTVVFADDSDISDYAREAVFKMAAAGVVGGDSNNCFLPHEKITRVSLCVMLNRALNIDGQNIQTGTDNPNGWNFYPPYEHILGDKIAESMPKPFDPETWERFDIVLIDLESTDFSPFSNSSTPKEGVEIIDSESFGGNNSIKLTKAAGASQISTTFVYNEEVCPGDWYAFSAMVKGDMSVGAPRIVIQAYSASGKWVTEVATGGSSVKEADWYNLTALLELPPETAQLRIMCYLLQSAGGTAYYDDLKVSKIIFDPMDTVLLTPSY